MHAPISVIIVHHNKLPYSRLCLESLLASDPLPTQILCIDNGSTDGTREYLGEQFPSLAAERGLRYELVANDSNVGACTARNQGLERAGEPLVAFCDNDLVTRSRNWLGTLQESLSQEAKNGIVGPKLVYPFEPYNIECAGAAISRTGRVQYRGRGAAIDTPAFNVDCEVQCLISACWLMKREITEALGGLDEVFNPAQFEDFDLCYRAREQGWRVLYTPRAEMYHFENTTTARSGGMAFKRTTIRNGLEFKRRWRHRFEQEDGPADEDCKWADLETRPLEATGVPPLL
ncbi:glycosyltransferase family 2 protein [bacterium]|nr:glycosyltransferase family 2 protein [bacterium]